MTVRPLDLDIAIYRDRIQVTDRATQAFVDQRADFPFSTDASIVAQPRFLEDTIVRAIRKILEGGFILRQPIAHVVACERPLSEEERETVRSALREAGMREIVFDL
ncbi:hypothetical protein [Qipengyuania zhejiangensis]|uniref:hypothetical protein n=1 Tax=Qipengyuania zhejiangensis TaxID=3077782 RepID=UPI002D764AB2|nr:hypothetical protein [Qipengyuania sp. Z2]